MYCDDMMLPDSPKATPIKPLPFSPSKFLNSPNVNFDDFISSSTPVRRLGSKEIKKELDTSSLETPNKRELFCNYFQAFFMFKKKVTVFGKSSERLLVWLV